MEAFDALQELALNGGLSIERQSNFEAGGTIVVGEAERTIEEGMMMIVSANHDGGHARIAGRLAAAVEVDGLSRSEVVRVLANLAVEIAVH